jgi:hypothetical protein
MGAVTRDALFVGRSALFVGRSCATAVEPCNSPCAPPPLLPPALPAALSALSSPNILAAEPRPFGIPDALPLACVLKPRCASASPATTASAPARLSPLTAPAARGLTGPAPSSPRALPSLYAWLLSSSATSPGFPTLAAALPQSADDEALSEASARAAGDKPFATLFSAVSARAGRGDPAGVDGLKWAVGAIETAKAVSGALGGCEEAGGIGGGGNAAGNAAILSSNDTWGASAGARVRSCAVA